LRSRALDSLGPQRFGLWPERLAADTGYGSAENLAWLVHERGIEPHIPAFEKHRTDGSFGRSDFTYDHGQDLYTCPGGKQLRRYWQDGRAAKARPPVDGLYKYRARKSDCDGCDLRQRCRPGDAGRKLLRRDDSFCWQPNALTPPFKAMASLFAYPAWRGSPAVRAGPGGSYAQLYCRTGTRPDHDWNRRAGGRARVARQ
jgi:hypothetical protein